jgi:hypothetical protein
MAQTPTGLSATGHPTGALLRFGRWFYPSPGFFVALPPGGPGVYLLSSSRSCWEGYRVIGNFGSSSLRIRRRQGITSSRNYPKNKAERFQDVRPAFYAVIADMKNPYPQKTELMFASFNTQRSQLSCQQEIMMLAESHSAFQTAAEARGGKVKGRLHKLPPFSLTRYWFYAVLPGALTSRVSARPTLTLICVGLASAFLAKPIFRVPSQGIRLVKTPRWKTERSIPLES